MGPAGFVIYNQIIACLVKLGSENAIFWSSAIVEFFVFVSLIIAKNTYLKGVAQASVVNVLYF